MKRYILFSGESYYANGGAFDLVDSFETVDECYARAYKFGEPDGYFNWYHYLDTVTEEVVIIVEGHYCGIGRL